MKIKNLKKTANRILKAIRNKEDIILYGDSDLDGITSVIILKESIENLGGRIKTIYFPDRDKEGYGLNKTALNFLNQESALLISLDCGISNFEEIDLAKKLGFEVIIIDHHEILNRLPKASIIVDPKQKGDRYPFKKLATAGIVFKLSEIFFTKNFSPQLRKSFLELVALATLADMMPREMDNKILIEEGLENLKESLRPGIRIFWERERILNNPKTEKEVVQKIISTLNVSAMENHFPKTYLLLTSKNKKEAKVLVQELIKKNYQRQMKIKKIIEEIELRVSKKINEPLIFEGSEDWEVSLIGYIASQICQKYQKPTFIFKKNKKESLGSVRTPVGVNSVIMMQGCANLLETFGGHPPAAGFKIKNENLEKFKKCLMRDFL